MTNQDSSGDDNRLLSDLPADILERLRPDLERVEAPLGMKIYDPFERIKYVYFPVNSIASIVATTSSGQSLEVSVVGGEGGVGLEVLMGTHTSPHKSMMQIAGSAFRIGAREIMKEFRRCEAFHDSILHFMQKLSVQVSQTTLCNRLHTIDERLPRWLLMYHDRVNGDVLRLTQEFMGLMLGSSRVSVAKTAKILQNDGYIKYVRGRITVLDRKGLEEASCDCYEIVKQEYDRKSI